MNVPSLASVAVLLFAGVAAALPSADLEQARKLAREGKTDAAIKAAQAAAGAAKDDAAPGRMIQDLLRAEGRHAELQESTPSDVSLPVASLLTARIKSPKKAEEALKALVGTDGAPPQARLDLAITLIDLEKLRGAQTEITAYIESQPEDAEGHYVLGRIRMKSGKAAAAQAPLQRAVELAPGWAPAVVLYAEVLREGNRLDESRAALSDALKLYPKNPRLVRGLVDDQLAGGEFAEAEQTAVRLTGMMKKDGAAFALLAEVQRQLGKLDAAEASAKKAVELAPSDAHAHRALGLVLEKKDDFDGALDAFEKAATLRPDWAQVHVDIGIGYSLIYDYATAEKSLQKAIKLDKKSMEAHFRLAQVQYFTDELKDAKKSITVVLKADGNDARANRLMGRILLAEGKGKQALKSFEKAAQADPDDVDSLRMIGKCWMALGKPEDALKALDRALARNENDAWTHFEYGKVLDETEEFDAAEEAYRDAIKLKGDQPYFHLYLAELLDEVMDDPEGALEHYEKYIELGGEDDDGEVKGRIEQLNS